MLPIKPAVIDTITYASFVREFLRSVLNRLVPSGDWRGTAIYAANSSFDAKLNEVVARMTNRDASEDECRRELGPVLVDEVERIGGLIAKAGAMYGYTDFASRYLTRERLADLVESRDIARLDILRGIAEDPLYGRVGMLRAIAAAMDGKDPASIPKLDKGERQEANLRVDGVASAMAGMCAHCSRFGAQNGENEGESDWKARKPRGSSCMRRRHGKELPAKMIETASEAWDRYRVIVTGNMSVNSRPTYEGAFARFKDMLEEVGISTLAIFRRVMNAIRNRLCRQRAATLAAPPPPAPPVGAGHQAARVLENGNGLRVLAAEGFMCALRAILEGSGVKGAPGWRPPRQCL